MADKKTAVFGIYESVAQAERAVDTLVNEAFADDDISVLLPDDQVCMANSKIGEHLVRVPRSW
jgi:hypothetical protein